MRGFFYGRLGASHPCDGQKRKVFACTFRHRKPLSPRGVLPENLIYLKGRFACD
jgi:hypothetical protein